MFTGFKTTRTVSQRDQQLGNTVTLMKNQNTILLGLYSYRFAHPNRVAQNCITILGTQLNKAKR